MPTSKEQILKTLKKTIPKVFNEYANMKYKQLITRRHFNKFTKKLPLEKKFALKLYGLARANKTDEMEETMNQMRENGIEPNVSMYNLMLQETWYGPRMNDFEYGEKIFNQMKERGIKPDNITLNYLMRIQIAAGERTKAIETFELFDEYGIQPDSNACYLVINEAIKAERYDMAFEIYEEMKASKIRIDHKCYALVVHAATKIKDYSVVHQVAMECLEADEPMDLLFPPLLVALFKNNNQQGAEELFEFILKDATEVDSYLFAIMLRGYADLGEMEKAQLLFDQIIETKIVEVDELLCSIMFYGYAKLGDRQGTSDFLMTLKHLGYYDKMELFKSVSLDKMKEYDEALLSNINDEELEHVEKEVNQMLEETKQIKEMLKREKEQEKEKY